MKNQPKTHIHWLSGTLRRMGLVFLLIAPAALAQRALPYGQPFRPRFVQPNTTDTFVFSGHAGDVVRLLIADLPVAGSSRRPCVAVKGPTNNTVYSSCASGLGWDQEFPLATSGLYTLTVNESHGLDYRYWGMMGCSGVCPDAPAAYPLADLIAPSTLTFTQITNQQVTQLDPIRFYVFYAAVGGRYTVTLQRTSSASACLNVQTPKGHEIGGTCSSGSANLETFTATTSGFHAAFVYENGYNSDMPYNLSLSCTGYCPPAPSSPLRFVPMAPCRLMETRAPYNFEGRSGVFGPPTVNAGETRTLNLPSSNVCSIPSTAKAYVLNVTLIPNGSVNYVTLWPAGESKPNVWTARAPDGQTVANSAIVKAGSNGGINVFTSDRTDLLIDINGYYTDASSGLAYYPMTPCRVIDTRYLYRSAPGPFGPPSMSARESRRFRFPNTPYCAVPVAAAYSVTLTVAPPGPLPYLTAWPAGASMPNVSSINSFAGRVLANNLTIPASADGSIDLFSFDTTDILVDINGYYAPDDGRGLLYFPVTQCRASDSTGGAAYPDETVRTINIATAPGCSGIAANAQGYAVNVTAIPNGNPMPFLTAYPTGQSRPVASILNAFQGQTVSNSAIIPAGSNGSIDVFAYRRTDVVVDVSGYFGR